MLQFERVPRDEFFLVRMEGLVSLEAWQEALPRLGDRIGAAPGDRLLVDLTALLGWLGIPERRSVGTLMASHFRRMRRVALVIQAEKISEVVEAEARRLGLDLKLFSNFDEAAAWVVA